MGDQRHSRQGLVARHLPRKHDAMLVSSLPNIRYLTGFSGSAAKLLLFRQGPAVFITDFRYAEQSAGEVGDAAQRVIFKKNLWQEVARCLRQRKVQSLAVEATATLGMVEALKKYFKGELGVVQGVVEKIRQEKDATEIEALRKAFSIADKALAKTLKHICPGKTEREVAARLEFEIHLAGGDGVSFPTILAAGENAACPHASPSDRVLRTGDMVKIDFGVRCAGYCSDMTRTVFLGPATPKFRQLYALVAKAQQAAIKSLRPGVSCIDVDRKARDIIEAKGYKENFGHGLGHALGLEVHESPSVSWRCKDLLKNGMVLTVEPGIYLPGWGGIRIEDVFVVNDNHPIRLTGTPNDLLELPVA